MRKNTGMYKYITKLKGEKEKEKTCLLENIYGSESNKLGKVEAEVEIPVGLKEFWSKIAYMVSIKTTSNRNGMKKIESLY